MPGRSGAALGGHSPGCEQSSGGSAGQEWSPKVKEAWKAVSFGPGGRSCHKEGPGMSLLIPRVPLEHFHTCGVQRCLGKVIGLTVAMYLAGRLGLHGAEFLEFLICELPRLQMETSPSALRSLQVLTLGVVKVGWCREDWGRPPRCTRAPQGSPRG